MNWQRKLVSLFVPFAMIVVAFFIVNQIDVSRADDALFSHQDEKTRECVKNALGTDVYNQLTSWEQITADMKVKMGQQGCFGQPATESAPPTTESDRQSTDQDESAKRSQSDHFAKMAEGERKCLTETLGEVRFKELEQGAVFTETDKNAMANSGCFGRSTTVGDNQIVPVKTNPFDDMHPSMLECLKGAFGESRFEELKNGAGFTEEDKQKVESAGCFKREQKYEGEGKPEGVNPEVEECVKGKLGEDRMKELRAKGEPPTPGEMEQLEGCFSQHKGSKPNPVYAREGVPTEVDKCLRLALGDRYEDIKRGLAPVTGEDRQAGYKCMGKADDPIAPPPEMAMPDSIKQCLAAAVGQQRFDAIAGGAEPTDEEKSKGETCFANHEKKAKSKTVKTEQILPPPSEEVPFIKEDATAIKVDKVEIKDGKVFVNGQTTQGTDKVVVDVYLYSDSIQVTATADKTGSWTLTYDGTLPEGDHCVYAVIKKGTDNVRSDAKLFQAQVAQAAELEPTQELIDESTSLISVASSSPTGQNTIVRLLYYVGAGVGLVALCLVMYFILRKRNLGKTESKDQSSPPADTNTP